MSVAGSQPHPRLRMCGRAPPTRRVTPVPPFACRHARPGSRASRLSLHSPLRWNSWPRTYPNVASAPASARTTRTQRSGDPASESSIAVRRRSFFAGIVMSPSLSLQSATSHATSPGSSVPMPLSIPGRRFRPRTRRACRFRVTPRRPKRPVPPCRHSIPTSRATNP